MKITIEETEKAVALSKEFHELLRKHYPTCPKDAAPMLFVFFATFVQTYITKSLTEFATMFSEVWHADL